MTATYKIVRFFKDDRTKREVAHGLSLEEAQEWCSEEETHGEDWFDGFYREWDEDVE